MLCCRISGHDRTFAHSRSLWWVRHSLTVDRADSWLTQVAIFGLTHGTASRILWKFCNRSRQGRLVFGRKRQRLRDCAWNRSSFCFWGLWLYAPSVLFWLVLPFRDCHASQGQCTYWAKWLDSNQHWRRLDHIKPQVCVWKHPSQFDCQSSVVHELVSKWGRKLSWGSHSSTFCHGWSIACAQPCTTWSFAVVRQSCTRGGLSMSHRRRCLLWRNHWQFAISFPLLFLFPRKLCYLLLLSWLLVWKPLVLSRRLRELV